MSIEVNKCDTGNKHGHVSAVFRDVWMKKRGTGLDKTQLKAILRINCILKLQTTGYSYFCASTNY